ncbi:MAG: hypothetical protein VXY56_12290, partial [Pseudomonadota bacterium]|nr:hypothetical protein [Pseudomonadota bacterium]
VYIEVNGEPVRTVHIARVEGRTKDLDAVNVYEATVTDGEVRRYRDGRRYTPAPTVKEWDAGVRFQHRYGDGVGICVAKALEALEGGS